jgi:asparagine synthase (glutamine-hydrolysing)
MCGIAGMQLPNGKAIDRDLLQRMNDLIAHRGPDGDGFFHEKNIGIGNRRLSIIDLENGDQPIFNEDKSVVVTYNGEIYNSPELRRDLIEKGHEFYTHADTEVLVHLYEEYGVDMLPKIRGMFAFAIYNRNSGELFLARDPLGIKPLFYSELESGLYYSSELRSLLHLSEFSRQIDPEAFRLYVTLNYIPAPWTIWKAAKRLEPGHWLKVQSGEIIDRGRYYKIKEKLWDGDLDSAVEELDRVINHSVRDHLLADVPIGAFLSGGLDSSLVTAMAQQHSDEPLQTYTVSFPDYPTYDESGYAKIVADSLNTDHEVIPVSAEEGSKVMMESLDHLDEPFADSSLVPVSIISKVTRQHVKVALSGDGGDELFAGYNKYQGLWLADRFGVAAPFMRMAAKLPISETRGTKFGERWRQFRKLSRLMSSDPLETHKRATISLEPELERHLLKSAYQNGDLLSGRLKSLWEEGEEAGLKGLDRSLYTDVNFVLPFDMLHKVDVSSMQRSLEVRVPFVDPVVASMAFRIPHKWKLRDGQRKWILNRVAERYLPKSILQRPKGGFGIPIGEWFRTDLREPVQELLGGNRLEKSEVWNATGATQIMEEHFSFRRDRFWELWNLFVFEWWRNKWDAHW